MVLWFTGIAFTASAQAWSSATGSKDVRRYVNCNGNMETRAALYNSLRVFHHLAVQYLVAVVYAFIDGIDRTDSYTAAAAYTFIEIYMAFPVCECRGAVCTYLLAAVTAYASAFINHRLAL